jgi:murein DD-endopeptidase MepM/ murein hydrolase activator NlpD
MNYLLPLIFSFVALPVMAQSPSDQQDPSSLPLFVPVTYPQGYFRNPLDFPMSLAANFGELRPNHYHMGLDIRTQHRENQSVDAAADGYVARVEIEPGGFGQAIYIRHPNGYTTVYGHLNQFFPALAAYVHQQQYRLQSWQVDLTLPPGLFPVRKGDFIAWSGSTGGSQGPHLHFEIRRTAGDINLNPLLFGLPVPDQTPPTLLRLAWYDRNEGIYEQSPHILPIRKAAPGPATAAEWSVSPALIIVPTSRISFALSAFDTQSGSANPNGIYEADLYVDHLPVIGFQMNNISYDDTRNINAHIDYKTRETGGPFLQQLFFLSGYPFPSIYRVPATPYGVDPAAVRASGQDPLALTSIPTSSDGVIDLHDGLIHQISIVVKDTYGNTSTLTCQVQYRPGVAAGTPSPYIDPNEPMPTSPNDTAGKTFYPGMIDGIELEQCAFYLGEKSLYDSVRLRISKIDFAGSGYLSLPGGISEIYRVGEPWIPLLEPVLIRMEPVKAFDVDSLPGAGWMRIVDKIVMVCTNGTQKDVQRPEWNKDSSLASARFHEFGNFQLVNDKTPPTITPLGPLNDANLAKATRIAFMAKDDLGAVRNFRAELDGHWLCFTNDKGLAYIYKFDEHCPRGPHVLKVSVEDVAGNRTTREYHFNR